MASPSMLRIVVLVLAVGAGASASPGPSGAVEPGWDVTIDGPDAVVDDKRIEITGTATGEGPDDLPPEAVTVTVVPLGLLPSCGAGPTATVPVRDGRYRVEIDVPCNGPHQIRAVAGSHIVGTSEGAVTRDIRVAEPPVAPRAPLLDETAEGGLLVSWEPTSDPDAVGWILRANFDEMAFGPAVTMTTLLPAHRRASIYVRAVRWGADGPGTEILSEWSGGTIMSEAGPGGPPVETTPEPPPWDPGPSLPHDPAPAPPPSRGGTAHPAPPAPEHDRVPSSGTGPTSTAVPEADGREPASAALPATAPAAPDPDTGRPQGLARSVAAGPAPIGGVVRTREERSRSLVATFALGLFAITIAVHVTWYRNRARTTGRGGRGRP